MPPARQAQPHATLHTNWRLWTLNGDSVAGRLEELEPAAEGGDVLGVLERGRLAQESDRLTPVLQPDAAEGHRRRKCADEIRQTGRWKRPYLSLDGCALGGDPDESWLGRFR